jgi:hypothetical protein
MLLQLLAGNVQPLLNAVAAAHHCSPFYSFRFAARVVYCIGQSTSRPSIVPSIIYSASHHFLLSYPFTPAFIVFGFSELGC